HIASGEPTIGGRYSALSPFGLVPAAVMGLDVAAFLGDTARMVDAIRSAPAATNAGVSLGLLLGTAAVAGQDKLTLIASPGIEGLGAWLEQLVAESTGKNGQAIVPVDLEAPAPADRDRARSGAGRRDHRPRGGRGHGRSCRRRAPARDRPGVLPLGDRHRGRGHG